MPRTSGPDRFFKGQYGEILLGDSLEWLGQAKAGSIDLVVTSPPFALTRKKEYGNEVGEEYLDWLRPFAREIYRVLKDSGSFVIDLGGAWNKGLPTRSLYQFEVLLMLCKEIGFHLAQDFYWWNPARIPSPAEWVTVRRIRVKDAVNTVWWLSKTPWPKASNTRIVQPYSQSMKHLLKNGYKAKLRPSGHDISTKFSKDNGGAIPPNLIALANTESNALYQRYCAEHSIKPHPARFPVEIPEYFVRMLTDVGDKVVDIFGGSCGTGEVCERLKRNWTCIDLEEEYLRGALGRFQERSSPRAPRDPEDDKNAYKLYRPDVCWNGTSDERLDGSGGKTRQKKHTLAS